MSRAFVKNDAADAEVVIPPRAPLPADAINYVTPRGMALLRTEWSELTAARARIASDERDEAERSRQLAVLGGRIAELHERIAGARVVDTGAQPHDEVRFGATVTLRTLSGKQAGEEQRRYTLVGVDEAAVAEGRVAFTAPIARAISGCMVGDKVVLRTAQGEQELEIVAIEYNQPRTT